MKTLKQLQEKALHTAKLVPQSQRDLFISEIENLTTLAFEAGKAEVVSDIKAHKFETYSANTVIRSGNQILSNVCQENNLIKMIDLNNLLDSLQVKE